MREYCIWYSRPGAKPLKVRVQAESSAEAIRKASETSGDLEMSLVELIK